MKIENLTVNQKILVLKQIEKDITEFFKNNSNIKEYLLDYVKINGKYEDEKFGNIGYRKATEKTIEKLIEDKQKKIQQYTQEIEDLKKCNPNTIMIISSETTTLSPKNTATTEGRNLVNELINSLKCAKLTKTWNMVANITKDKK